MVNIVFAARGPLNHVIQQEIQTCDAKYRLSFISGCIDGTHYLISKVAGDAFTWKYIYLRPSTSAFPFGKLHLRCE